MNRMIASSLVIFALAFAPVVGANQEDDQSIGQQLNEARLEGQLFATYALNRHLNPFDIGVDVKGDAAVLKGKVEDSVQKDLAEQIALGTGGIEHVDNRIEVAGEMGLVTTEGDDERGFGTRVRDVTTSATISSKLLWNRNTRGLPIEVVTKSSDVTLKGKVDSDATRELVERMARNTDGVADVDNQLVVDASIGEDSGRGVDDAISDGWITTKVKSTLLFSRNVSGMAINVDTKDGIVTLKGEVGSGAEKELAVKLAEDVRGVRKVKANELRVTG